MDRDLFREELDELAPHIEDDIRTGAFEMSEHTEAYVRLFTNIHRSEKKYASADTGIFPAGCSRCTYPTIGRCQECNVPLCFLCQNGGKDGAMVCLECHVEYIREQAALQQAWNELQAVPSYIERYRKVAQEV